MQVEYRKEWMDTYLWVLPDKHSPESYEEKMIRCNPDGGWLAFSRQSKDGEEYLCYKVTGKKALNSIYGTANPFHFRTIICHAGKRQGIFAFGG